MSSLEEWITSRRIEEVECLVPDMSGIARGKILPSAKFIKGAPGLLEKVKSNYNRENIKLK